MYDRLTVEMMAGVSDEVLIELVKLADILCVEDVGLQCKEFFLLGMSLENAVSRIVAAHRRNATLLFAITAEFVMNYYWELKVSLLYVVFSCLFLSVSMLLFYVAHYARDGHMSLHDYIQDRDLVVNTAILLCSVCGITLLVTGVKGVCS